MARSQLVPAGALLLGPLLLAARAGGQVTQWSRLNSGSFCSDYGLSSVADSTECFNTAATYLGISVTGTVADGLGFDGCVYNTVTDTLLFGTSPSVAVISTLEYICRGVPTSTTTTSTVTIPETTVTYTGYLQGYTMIFENERCSEYLVPDVTDETECFNSAAPYVGITGAVTRRLDYIGFTGCVYNTGNGEVYYGEHPGAPNIVLSFYKFICKGQATTTTTTTTSTVTTSTVTTSTVTTSTTSTTSVTTSTSTTTTSTVTSSTSTLTTSTSSTTTATSSTSTVTTVTMTGSSSTTTSTTFTETTTETQTFTTTTTETQTFTTTTTETTSTSTMTTMTTTYTPPPWSGFVGDDPITYYNNVMHKFWLPEGELVPLLRTPELQLLGSATTIGGEQYIKQLAVRGPADESVLQVSIREGLDGFRKGDPESDSFETLNVTLGDWAGGHHMASLPGKDAYAHRWQSLAFAFQRLADAQIGEARAEMAVVGGESATVLIMSVAASGFEGDLAAKHAHLDFVLQMKRQEACEGILPELWGVRPMSNQTLSLLEEPPA